MPNEEQISKGERGPIRVLMWSGPRNISTAMLRSFENRDDTFVSDEPLYAYYLDQTGYEHPGREEVIDVHDANWRSVINTLTSTIPRGKAIWYQKQMAHHLLPEVDRAWLMRDDIVNSFLIREPREMLTSLINVLGDVDLDQTAMPQQVEILRAIKQAGKRPVVVDSRDVQDSPRRTLEKFCSSVGIPFSERMLNWPDGPRDSDAVWGKHWYANVYRTTTFGRYRPKEDVLPSRYNDMLRRCEDLYNEMAEHRI